MFVEFNCNVYIIDLVLGFLTWIPQSVEIVWKSICVYFFCAWGKILLYSGNTGDRFPHILIQVREGAMVERMEGEFETDDSTEAVGGSKLRDADRK